ncbi:hypothetical protein CDD82_1483 [Ophiocordyceps australis]|uniref:Zn(2)-C6 fungal-type domain-containing protein n=1 Tax=Ophiocordyceps australis TaxID=1399860 RepID=A0A2C5ZFV9_9HYPO|nr:hypothetical protein CDD82_1483 [Ophiocordyceps australis]
MSSFTALNGTTPKDKDLAQTADAADKLVNVDDGPRNGAAPRSRKSPILHPNHKESWQERDCASSRPTRGLDMSDCHKRKRSASDDDKREPRYHVQAAPNMSQSTSHRRYNDDFQESKSPSLHRERDDRLAFETQHSSIDSNRGHSEERQAGEARRHTSASQGQSDHSQASPDAEEASVTQYDSSYAAEQRQDSILQHDPKKRKRNFSNRTKTGCLTCRKRKKKCDEQKPECSNCIRGGFVCAGYPPQRGPGWQKPDNKTAAIPLESKDPSYVPPGAYGMPQHGVYAAQPVKREPLPHYRGQALRIDPPQGKSLAVSDDDRHTASTLASASATSPDNKLSAMAYTPNTVFPTPVSANTQPSPPFGEIMAKEYQRMPSLHELSRSRPDVETPHSATSLPHITVLNPTRASSPASHTPTPVSSAQGVAQLALSHTQYPTARRTQKDEMLAGRHFYPLDKELCLERERCMLACWKFNSLTPPPHGVSFEERARLFLDILQPRDPVRLSAAETSTCNKMGRLGRNVALETPFTCDYGYNIFIGNQVLIKRNCTINDAGEVNIGDHCVIGPNVSIFTSSLPVDPKKRQGGLGPQHAKSVSIEQDCWIGGGAIILPGRTIGKGSTVGAGSVVTKDVPPFTVVAGNPARVLRGVGI